MGLHIANERIASIDNDIADLLSRGAIEEALRFPKSANVRTVELNVPAELRRLGALE